MSTEHDRLPTVSAGSGPPEIDLAAAQRLLTTCLGGEVSPLEAVGVGAWSRCLGFTGPDGRELVLRIGHHPADFACDVQAAAHRSPDLPIPAVVATGAGLGAHWAVCERVRGTFLEDLDADGWRAVLPALLRTLSAIRALPRPVHGGYGPWDERGHGAYPSWRAYLLSVADDRPGDRTHGWATALAARPSPQRFFDRGLTLLGDLAEAGEGHRVAVHADLLHGNVFIDRSRITGVIDWGSALDGDPVQELAELEMWAPWHPGLAAIDVGTTIRKHLRTIGVPAADLESRLRACLLHTSLASLAYNAFRGDDAELRAVCARMEPFLE